MLENLKIGKLVESHFDHFEDDNEEFEREDHLCYEIRKFLSNDGIESFVERDNLDISVYVFLNKTEKFTNVFRTFDYVLNYLKKEILSEYEVDFELYESKQGIPIFLFKFIYENEETENEKDLF